MTLEKKIKIGLTLFIIGIICLHNLELSYGGIEKKITIINEISPNEDIIASTEGNWLNFLNNGKTNYSQLDITINNISLMHQELWLNNKERVYNNSTFRPGDQLNIYLDGVGPPMPIEIKSFNSTIFSAYIYVDTIIIPNYVPTYDEYSKPPLLLSIIIILSIIFLGFEIWKFKKKRDKFLKPDWRKVTIAIIMFFTLPIPIMTNPNLSLIVPGEILLNCLQSPICFETIIILLFLALPYYFLSCLMTLIYDKLRGKKQSSSPSTTHPKLRGVALRKNNK